MSENQKFIVSKVANAVITFITALLAIWIGG